MAYATIGKGEGGKAYGHVPGHYFHDVHARVKRNETKGGERFRVSVSEVWGSAQGRDEVHGSKCVSVTGIADLDDAINAVRVRAIAAGMDRGYLETALAEVVDDAEHNIENDLVYS